MGNTIKQCMKFIANIETEGTLYEGISVWNIAMHSYIDVHSSSLIEAKRMEGHAQTTIKLVEPNPTEEELSSFLVRKHS
jgi:hypothetical protein